MLIHVVVKLATLAKYPILCLGLCLGLSVGLGAPHPWLRLLRPPPLAPSPGSAARCRRDESRPMCCVSASLGSTPCCLAAWVTRSDWTEGGTRNYRDPDLSWWYQLRTDSVDAARARRGAGACGARGVFDTFKQKLCGFRCTSTALVDGLVVPWRRKLCVCVCVGTRACVRVCVGGCARVCACVRVARVTPQPRSKFLLVVREPHPPRSKILLVVREDPSVSCDGKSENGLIDRFIDT